MMKRFIFSKITIVFVVHIMLLVGLYYGTKSIAMVHDRAVVPVYLVAVKPDSAKTYDENGFFIGQFVGEFDYEGHRFEQNISISQRFELIQSKKPVRHMKLLSAAEIGLDTPFNGPGTYLFYILSMATFFLMFLFTDLPKFYRANQKTVFDENKACS